MTFSDIKYVDVFSQLIVTGSLASRPCTTLFLSVVMLVKWGSGVESASINFCAPAEAMQGSVYVGGST